jgi:hypothetical protein
MLMSAFQDMRDVQIATIASLTAEVERLRFHLKNMTELADEFTPDEPDDFAGDLLSIQAAYAALQPKEGER